VTCAIEACGDELPLSQCGPPERNFHQSACRINGVWVGILRNRRGGQAAPPAPPGLAALVEAQLGLMVGPGVMSKESR
jgi:hypothetical protein